MTLTLEDAIQEVQDGLGYRQDKRGEIIASIVRSQRLLEQGKTQPWFLIESTNIFTVADESNIEYPDDYNRISRDYAPFITESGTTNRTYLKERLGDEAAKLFYGEIGDEEPIDPGKPRSFALLPLTLRVYPVPDDAYTIRFTYYKHAEVLSESQTENEWTLYGFDALVSHAGLRMAKRLRNQEAQAMFQEQWAECSNSLFRQFLLKEDEERPIYAGSVF